MRGEKGQALPLAMIALTIGALVIAPFLGHADASLVGSRTYGSVISARNAADAGVEHAIWSLTYGTLAAQIPDAGDQTTYQLGETLNGLSTSVTVTTNATGSTAGAISNAPIDTFTFDSSAGYTPAIIQVSTSVYAIVYRGPSNRGYVKTISIDASGNIGNTAIDTLNFDTTACYEPDITHVTGNYYAIAYRSSASTGYLKTISITSAGDIGNIVVSSMTFDSTACYTPSITQVTSNYYAIAYRGFTNRGYVKTVYISSSGIINGTATSTLTLDSTAGYEPNIIHVTGTYYAIAYRGASNRGTLKTISISTSGVINGTVTSTLVFDTTAGYEPVITQVATTIFAIAYRGSASGNIKTVSINSSGVIGSSTISSQNFDTAVSYLPDTVPAASSIYALAYSNSTYKGYLKTMTIGTDGTISPTIVDTLNFDATSGYEASIVNVTGEIFAIAYRGPGSDGYVITVDISSASAPAAYRISSSAGGTTTTALVNTQNTTSSIVSWQIK